jgi:hypothetical protein
LPCQERSATDCHNSLGTLCRPGTERHPGARGQQIVWQPLHECAYSSSRARSSRTAPEDSASLLRQCSRLVEEGERPSALPLVLQQHVSPVRCRSISRPISSNQSIFSTSFLSVMKSEERTRYSFLRLNQFMLNLEEQGKDEKHSKSVHGNSPEEDVSMRLQVFKRGRVHSRFCEGTLRVPRKGQLKIAQHFQCWVKARRPWCSPGGTAEPESFAASVVPVLRMAREVFSGMPVLSFGTLSETFRRGRCRTCLVSSPRSPTRSLNVPVRSGSSLGG